LQKWGTVLDSPLTFCKARQRNKQIWIEKGFKRCLQYSSNKGRKEIKCKVNMFFKNNCLFTDKPCSEYPECDWKKSDEEFNQCPTCKRLKKIGEPCEPCKIKGKRTHVKIIQTV